VPPLAAPTAQAPTSQRTRLARSGLIGLLGSVVNGAAAFGVVLAVTRGLDDTSSSGAVFLAMAVFNIAYIVCTLGADVAVVRAVARNEASETSIVRTALAPTLGLSLCVAIVIGWSRGTIAGLLLDGVAADTLSQSLLAVAPFIPAASVTSVLIATTRGRGTMTPTAIVERISRPGAQLLLLGLAGFAGFGITSTALAWSVTFGFGLIPAVIWFLKGSPPREFDQLGNASEQDRPAVENYWRFAAPQALTTVLQVVLRWADIVLVAALADASTAAVYTAASRLLLAGNFLNLAVVQAISPMVSSALAREDRDEAQDLLRVGTSWLVTAVWPGYLLLIAFGPSLLSLFGTGYAGGGTALAILAGAMLVASAVGPIEAVLLMSGGAKLSLADNTAAVALNIGLNIALVPPMGIEGAAIAWAVALLVTNLAPLVQVHRRLGINPFGSGHRPAIAASLAAVGVPALLLRFAVNPGLLGVIVAGAAIVGVYLFVLNKYRSELHLSELTSALRPRRPTD